jgi:ABC-type branched-subunit amino acid transport system permease subunit
MTVRMAITPNLTDQPNVRTHRIYAAAGFLGVVVLLVYPLLLSSYEIDTARDALLFGMVAISLDYLWGKAGVLSFGHGAFFGLGAYGVTIVGRMVPSDNAALVGLGAGIGLSCFVAGAVGYFLIFGGVRGSYLTIMTLAIALVARNIATGWASVTGGEAGLMGAPGLSIGMPGFTYHLDGSVGQYLLVVLVVCAVLIGLWLGCRGHYGRILAAIQDDEPKLLSLGYNTSAHLLFVFVLSASIAALAGGLYASFAGFVAPDLIGLFLSTQAVVWVAVGGRGTLLGPLIGAILVIRLQTKVSSFSYSLWPIIIGAFFIAMVFLFPDGLLPMLSQQVGSLVQRFRRAAR